MRHFLIKYSKKLMQALALSATVFFSSASHAAGPNKLAIANAPLFLGAAVSPNVLFVTDDSGSMDWEILTGKYWRWYHYDPDPIRDGTYSSGTPRVEPLPTENNRNPDPVSITSPLSDGVFHSAWFGLGGNRNDGRYSYIYNNADHRYSSNCSSAEDGKGRVESCSNTQNNPLDADWRGRSSGLNKIFYNSDILYEPWDGPCASDGALCENADFTKARSNPYFSQDGYNLTRDLSLKGDAHNGPFIYDVWIDDSGYTGTIPRRGNNFNETGYARTKFGTVEGIGDEPNQEVDLWDSHMQITVSSSTANVSLIAYNPEKEELSKGLNRKSISGVVVLDSPTACYNVLGSSALVKGIRDAVIADLANAADAIKAIDASGCRSIKESTQNIANWYQYYRRRAYPVKNAIAEVMDSQPNFRFGLTVLGNIDPNKTYRSSGFNKGIFTPLPAQGADLANHILNIKKDYFEFVQPAQGTPLRSALTRAGEYFKKGIDLSGNVSHSSPILFSCQKNFTILLTDGFWNGDSNFSVGTPNDGDGVPNTVADVAYKYYIKDLRNDLDNDVPLDPQESDLRANREGTTENTTIQHMVTFTVAFGVVGQLKDESGDGNPDKDAAGVSWSVPVKSGNWGKPQEGPAAEGKIDDLWHAAFNSGGIFASASTPTEVSRKLINAISNTESRLGTAAAVALNSGTLNANSRLYQARFNSSGWSGNLFSIPIQDGPVDVLPVGAPDGDDDSPPECDNFQTLGELCAVEWNAAVELAGLDDASREIFTMKINRATTPETFTPVAFKVLSDLGIEQQAALNANPDSPTLASDSLGQERLDYIRGDHDNESDAVNGVFRVRNEVVALDKETKLGVKNRMGDIVHSAPAFVGAPSFFYPESIETESYAKFKFDNRARAGMVYVGTNEGMLHGFNATTGKEEFAYIPGTLVEKLNVLTATSYNNQHQYYVDGSPVVFDAFNGTAWKTMLASSLGAGGQVVFGLDVTDPANFGADDVAWEFTDNPRTAGTKKYGDKDLGYTIGDVSFAKTNAGNGLWAAIFGNGYNNTEDDGFKSETGNGAIYVVDAFTGELIRKFDTLTGWAQDPLTDADRPNGVASVTPVDIDGDFKVDYLYAGDLFGNLWKMDVRNASADSWTITRLFVATGPGGEVQPITSGVAVKRHPINRDQTLVLFGTGKYLELNDNGASDENSDIQTFYSIWDDNTSTNTGTGPDRSALLQQTIDAIRIVDGVDDVKREFRVTSFKATGVDWATQKGWYMDLRLDPEYGEEVVVTPIVRNNRVIFVTQTLTGTGVCDGLGTSWIMELDANTGNRLLDQPFDVDGNGIINDADLINYLGVAGTVTSGVRSKQGVVASPGILNNRNSPSEFKYFAGTGGGVDVVTESADAEYRQRQSWRQLR